MWMIDSIRQRGILISISIIFMFASCFLSRMIVVYLDQLLGAAGTKQLVKTLFWLFPTFLLLCGTPIVGNHPLISIFSQISTTVLHYKLHVTSVTESNQFFFLGHMRTEPIPLGPIFFVDFRSYLVYFHPKTKKKHLKKAVFEAKKCSKKAKLRYPLRELISIWVSTSFQEQLKTLCFSRSFHILSEKSPKIIFNQQKCLKMPPNSNTTVVAPKSWSKYTTNERK